MKKSIAILLLMFSGSVGAAALSHDEISMYCKQDAACVAAFKVYAYQNMLNGFIHGLCDSDSSYQPEGKSCAQIRMDNLITEIAGKDAEQKIKSMLAGESK